MKNILILISFLFFAFTLNVNAQNESKTLGTNASNITYTGDAADTIVDTGVWYMRFNLASKNKRQGYHLMVKVDSISGTCTGTCVLSGSDDQGTTKTTITSHTLTTISPSDTIVYFSDVGTGVLWRDLYITVTGSGTMRAKLNKIYGKIGDL